MKTVIYQVDSFTASPFAGNPAGVCILTEPQPDRWMSTIAREMNCSETAFLLPEGDAYRLRWFTPMVEVDLCGHATLAAAHILWEVGRLQPDETARFLSRSGLLTAKQDQGWIELNFPVQGLLQEYPLIGLSETLGAVPCFAGSNGVDLLVELEDEETVRRLAPDIAAIKKLPFRGVIVTAKASTPGLDFVSRFFAPAVGIDEDPVTGSAHTFLTPYWSIRLARTEMNAFQASARGGDLKVRLLGDRVGIAGQAVTVLKGEMEAR